METFHASKSDKKVRVAILISDKIDFKTKAIKKTEKVMAPHSSALAWKTPWMEEPGRLQSMGSLRVGRIVFSPLYILASFVKDTVSIGVWICLWAFYFVPLIYIFVFVPVPCCPDDCSFVV